MKHLAVFFATLFILATMNPAVALADQRGRGYAGLGIYFDETFFPVYVKENDTTSVNTVSSVTATESGLGFNTYTTLGYVFWHNSVIFGLTYNAYSLTTKRPNIVDGDTGKKETTTESMLGPTLGWLNGRFRTLITYFVKGEKKLRTIDFDETGTQGDKTITNTDMLGFQISIGYTFALWRGFEVGPSLNYVSVKYKKQKAYKVNSPAESYDEIILDSPYMHDEIKPMISLTGRF